MRTEPLTSTIFSPLSQKWSDFQSGLKTYPYSANIALFLFVILLVNYCSFFRTYILRRVLRLQSGCVKRTLPIIEPKETGPCPLGLPFSNDTEVITISDDENDDTNERPHAAEWRVVISSKNYKC